MVYFYDDFVTSVYIVIHKLSPIFLLTFVPSPAVLQCLSSTGYVYLKKLLCSVPHTAYFKSLLSYLNYQLSDSKGEIIFSITSGAFRSSVGVTVFIDPSGD